MAVNGERMLPFRVRKMCQMEDLLQAEQVMLGTIEDIIEDMIYEASLLTAETVTPEYLKKLVTEVFKRESTIEEYPEELIVKIRLNINSGEPSSPLLLIEKTNIYIPAHLKVLYEYVSKHLLKGVFYVAQPRADYVRVSYPYAPLDSRLQKTVNLYTAIPVLEYVELNVPVNRGGLE